MDKPTFETTPTLKPQEKPNNINEERVEAGVIWENRSKKSNSKYMNIIFSLPKSKLQDIINNSDQDENGNVKFGFVAFPNKLQDGISNRPAFRIYQNIKIKENTKTRTFSTKKTSSLNVEEVSE